ncbi:TetR/AcrR family transcriptional regulator [Paenibacillus lactis]|uniref:TetR/AcrR family transcriptional regulator n=1 Tax=Paenibacillus lactis TaxID=228574 RepID=UPI00203C812C|nr:TetR/AcrR family transcriptional regulator [Paenibacillus lactis]MCM3493216.1 TetR/AcrR family transcriptional regulator [Paenibacillus lactis]
MAPKPKFTKQDIILAAFDIARAEGLNSVSIRKVADRLGCSIAPIYVNFADAEELLQRVVEHALHVAKQMITGQRTGQPFRDIGMASLRFAREFPLLYRDLIMKNNPYMKHNEEQLNEVVELMKEDPGLAGFSGEELRALLIKMQTFQTGLSVMVANDLFTTSVNEEQVMAMMNEAAEDFIRAARLRQAEPT